MYEQVTLSNITIGTVEWGNIEKHTKVMGISKSQIKASFMTGCGKLLIVVYMST